MTASFEGHVDIVRILIEAKAQVNTQDEVCCNFTTQWKAYIYKNPFFSQAGWTALHLASQGGKAGVVKLLTEAEAQVNLQTEVCILLKIILRTPQVSISFSYSATSLFIFCLHMQ